MFLNRYCFNKSAVNSLFLLYCGIAVTVGYCRLSAQKDTKYNFLILEMTLRNIIIILLPQCFVTNKYTIGRINKITVNPHKYFVIW